MQCLGCGIGVSCPCQLTNGYCNSCLMKQGSNSQPNIIPDVCTYTLSEIESLRDCIKNFITTDPVKYTSNNGDYLMAVLNSQINIFATKPCHYKEIIKFIKELNLC
jgi:hypothetical protein